MQQGWRGRFLAVWSILFVGFSPWAFWAYAATPTSVYLPLIACGTNCTTSTPQTYSAFRLEVIQMLNAERIKVGCSAALVEPTLMSAAQGWSDHISAAADYRHSDSDWYQQNGYDHLVNENIGGGVSAQLVVTNWMASPPHRANILNCAYSNPSSPDYRPGTVDELGFGYTGGYAVLAMGINIP